MTLCQAQLTLAPNGPLLIPVAIRAALGLAAGGKLVARLVDGAIVLEPVGAAIARAQAMVARYVPTIVSLADELIADRHTAAEPK